MLTDAQRTAVWDFLLARTSEAEFVAAVGADPRTDADFLPGVLSDAVRRADGDQLEAALSLMVFFDQLGADPVPLLCRLLVADWHRDHENIARFLQEYADPRAVPALRRAADMEFAYRDFDDSRALSRKCMWALSDIRTAEAVAALESLTGSADERVRDLAAYHLAKVRDGEPPSRVSGRRRAR
ncbi:hypothetical protein O7635_22430 [Asanoa sp. WMMD1127]|uniref:hypothetical protein n=1 Tax=Asanoa sp. WMMD1127 TaxID=3016107 RepID=UPI002417047D|nr:hypothetical protein [Asanoa sp. WMMD1127]MDG4824616.1 hypothetical protein [Asanoa sp. WMMD1127]